MTDTTTEELDAIAAAAAAARPALLRSTATERAAWLRAIADALDAASPELVALADEETHLGAPRLTGEVGRTTGQLRLFADVVTEGSYLEAAIDHADPASTPPRPDLRRMLRPLGTVAVFSASNFPFAFSVAGGDTASALAVGCPVIVKAHPGHARLSRATAHVVNEALAAAGAPVGAFALVEGHHAGVALVQHPAVAAVAFTGSVAGGRALHELASLRAAPIPFFGELGSINPVVVTRAADAARGADLAKGLAASFTLGAGQFCTKPGVVLVPVDSTLESAIGDFVESGTRTLLTPSIAEGFGAGVQQLLALDGARVVAGVVGGTEPLVIAVDAATAAAHADTVLGEVFGPVTVLIGYRDDAELHGVIDELEGSLTATVHAEADDEVSAVVDRFGDLAGRVLFGGWPTGVAVAWAQHHGGPWPATTSQHTSVGTSAARRFLRPIAFQDAPEALLPEALREANPMGIPRRVDGVLHPARA